MKDIRNWTPEAIYRRILRDDPNKHRIYIIFGRGGPTGKTWLWNKLRNSGYTATEISEALVLNNIVHDYSDDNNHYIIDDWHNTVVIVLNKILYQFETTLDIREK